MLKINANKKKATSTILTGSVTTVLFILFVFGFVTHIQPANALIDIGWDVSSSSVGHNLGDGAVVPGIGVLTPTVFNVTDSSFAGNGILDTVTVTVSTISTTAQIKDTATMMLFEVHDPINFDFTPDPNSGKFVISSIVFNPDSNARFSIGNTIDVTQIDNGGTHLIDNTIDTISVTVVSSTDVNGISLTLTETAKNTGIFKGQITLGTSTIPNSSIKVSAGYTVSVKYAGKYANIAVTNSTASGIFADVGDKIRISYAGHTADVSICACGDPGGGGGGLIRPGLVLELIRGIVGGSPFIVTPPSFGGGLVHYSDGLTIVKPHEKYAFDISKYFQDVDDQVLVADQPVNMTLKMSDPYNINAIIHSGLYFIPKSSDMITPNSIASIVYDKSSKLEINDPTKLFSKASVTSSNDGKFQYFSFNFIPTRSYEKMSFLARSWNDHKYSTDVIFHDAAISKPKLDVLPIGFVKYDNFKDLISKIQKEEFKKPQIMEHIHGTTDVFASNEGGHVYWLYDSVTPAVTLVISDNEGNTLFSSTEPLIQKEVQPKGDYSFMKFTVKQLNRGDVDGEQKIMKEEELKAMEKEMLTEGYHQENRVWTK